MFAKRPHGTTVLLLLSLSIACGASRADLPRAFAIQGVPRIEQMKNYCGPACLDAVFQYFGKNIGQEAIGREIYDPVGGATGGADMLFYARGQGMAAYSWNSSLSDVKHKIAAGIPVIVLQQNSATDQSGHYRVLTGYDDGSSKFSVVDPYYESITELTYSDCEKLWAKMGHWALLLTPAEKDTFKHELDARNPVVHMDLSNAEYKRKNYDAALREANLALALEPNNSYAVSLAAKIQRAMGAGAK